MTGRSGDPTARGRRAPPPWPSPAWPLSCRAGPAAAGAGGCRTPSRRSPSPMANTVIAVQTAGKRAAVSTGMSSAPTNWQRRAGRGRTATTFSAPAMIQDGDSVVIARAAPTAPSTCTGSPNGRHRLEQGSGRRGRGRPTPRRRSRRDGKQRGSSRPRDPPTVCGFYWAVNGTSTWTPEVVAGAGHDVLRTRGDGERRQRQTSPPREPSGSLDFYWAANGSAHLDSGSRRGAPGPPPRPPAISASYGWVTIFALDGSGVGSSLYRAQKRHLHLDPGQHGPLRGRIRDDVGHLGLPGAWTTSLKTGAAGELEQSFWPAITARTGTSTMWPRTTPPASAPGPSPSTTPT